MTELWNVPHDAVSAAKRARSQFGGHEHLVRNVEFGAKFIGAATPESEARIELGMTDDHDDIAAGLGALDEPHGHEL